MNTGEIAGEGHCDEHHHHHKIHFEVDGEPIEVLSSNREETELAVREVLEISANKPADKFWLVEFVGEGHKERREYKDLDQRIAVKNHARFAAICEKPTPLS